MMLTEDQTEKIHRHSRIQTMKAWAYITANNTNRVLYTGVTSNLKARIKSHKTKKYPNSFSAKYNAAKLVWYQEFDSIFDALAREKQIKSGPRLKKIKLIEQFNPDWIDLFNQI